MFGTPTPSTTPEVSRNMAQHMLYGAANMLYGAGNMLYGVLCALQLPLYLHQQHQPPASGGGGAERPCCC